MQPSLTTHPSVEWVAELAFTTPANSHADAANRRVCPCFPVPVTNKPWVAKAVRGGALRTAEVRPGGAPIPWDTSW